MMLKSSLWLPCKKNIQQKNGGGFWHEKNEQHLTRLQHYTHNTTRKEERIQKKMKNLGLIKAMATHSTL
uniref:Uncharacterized protein n=1 Tax=Solanum tuberosum TaxID=4113 RepID=M1CYM8_SOLTU